MVPHCDKKTTPYTKAVSIHACETTEDCYVGIMYA